MAAPNGEAGNGLATEHTTSPTWSSPQLRTVTVTRDALSFSDRQTTALTELDRRMYSELRRRQRDWQYSVQRARSGFLRLLPADVSISSSNTAAPAAGNKTSSLQSSADIVPVHKVRAQYFEHVDDDANDDDDYDASHDPSTRSKRDETQSDDAAVKSRGRYQIRFDVSDFAPSSVSVIVEGDAIVVRATRSGPLLTPCHRAVTHDDSPSAAADDSDRLYLRRVAKPDAVDRTRIQAVLSADGILTVEAPVSPPTADGRHHHHQQQLDTVGCTAAETGKAVSKKAGDLNGVTVEIEEGIDSTLKTADKDDKTKKRKEPTVANEAGKTTVGTPKSPRSASQDLPGGKAPGAAASIAASPAAGADSPGGGSSSGGGGAGEGTNPSKEKVGVPIFRDECGTRRMHLAVDLGPMYRPRDVIVQVIKENRIQIRAKHRERSDERQSKNKFVKDYELGEKIEPFSLQGGLTANGKLIVCAYAKGHGPVMPD